MRVYIEHVGEYGFLFFNVGSINDVAIKEEYPTGLQLIDNLNLESVPRF